MESSRTSNTSTATTTNVTMASVSATTAAAATATMDNKPDDLVSSGEINQMSSSQGQHGERVASASAIQHHHQQQLHQQHNSHQHKKCLHHRIFDASNTNAMNERVAALTNALLHQVTQQNLTQGSQMIQRPFPLQQTTSSQQQSHLMRQQQIQAYQQQYPLQQMPTTIGINSSMMQTNVGGSGSNGGTHFTVGINNTSVNGSAAVAAAAASVNSNGPIIHNQNGLVQKMNAALLAERYLLLDLVEGSTLYKCIDVKTHEELVCKVCGIFYILTF